jgi:hypothetical protein
MGTVEREQVVSALTSKGFVLEERDHIFLFLRVDGRKTGIYTYVSRGKSHRVLSDDILTFMKKQLRLDTKRQLLELVECPMDLAAYIALLRARGLRV